jgi:hypothetical protein
MLSIGALDLQLEPFLYVVVLVFYDKLDAVLFLLLLFEVYLVYSNLLFRFK